MAHPLRNTGSTYGLVAQLLHWLVALGVLVQFIWAWRIDEADSIRAQFALVNQHKSIGMTVLALALLRIGWRLLNPVPALPVALSRLERWAGMTTHWLLYALILAIPLSGWAYTSAAGYGAEFFGLLDVPDIVGSSETLEERFETVHESLGLLLAVVLVVHVGAALRHHFLLRDDVLKRMVPFWK